MRRLALLLAATAVLSAHDLVVQVERASPAVVLRASYDGADIAGRADVAIFRPGDSESPYQTGSTDAGGAFAFVPSEAGVWVAVVDDGFGHRTQKQVEWSETPPAAAPAKPHMWRDALTGVSLLVGLTGIWLWRQSRSTPGSGPSPR